MSTVLANTSTRPVELHLTAGVVVIPPMGTIECTAEDLELGQVRVLSRRGVLVIRPVAAPEQPAPADDEESAAEAPTEDQPSERPRRQKATTARGAAPKRRAAPEKRAAKKPGNQAAPS